MSVEDVLDGTSTVSTRLLLSVAEERGGAAAVDRALRRAGLAGQATLLRSVRGRIPYEVKLRLFDAVAAETGDPAIGRALGAAALADPALAACRAKIRAVGSPAAVLEQASRVSTRLDSAVVLRCLSADAGSATVTWQVLPPHRPSRVDCDYSIGLLTQAPVLFGLPPARVEHRACQVDGAPECTYAVSWSEPSSALGRRRWLRRRSEVAAADRAAGSGDERLCGLQEAAADLVGGGSLEATLDRVTERADRAVHGPGHLLDVELGRGRRHVRARGLGESVRRALGQERLAPGTHEIDGTQVIAVPVATAARTYGVLAVVTWPGQQLFGTDVELLHAYARHAAAAIEMSGLLAEAREQEETARLLLSVARSLTGLGTAAAIAQAVADAVPTLCGADRSAVALWEPGARRIWMAGLSGWPAELAEEAARYVTTTDESPELCQLIATGAPMLLDDSSSDWAREVLARFGLAALAAVPISVDDGLIGVVLAHWVGDAPAALGEAMTERLWGLAGLAGVALDHSRLREEIRHRAAHDPLTGLPNREVLELRVQAALQEPAAAEGRVALLVGDVGRLTRVNDCLGHAAGDEVLREVGRRLAGVVREGSDTVARYSGDAFAVLLRGAGDREAREVARRIAAVLSPPVDAGGEQVVVHLDLGIAETACRPGAAGDAVHAAAEDLVQRAMADLSRAKARRRGLLCPTTPTSDQLRLETDLHGAVDRGEIEVHLQPQVDLADGRIVAVEALARWEHPVVGLVPPDVFVPLAEASGLIRGIGEAVLRQACGAVARWRAEGTALEVAVNVSAVQLTDPGFGDLVTGVLAEVGLPADALTLEVTESQVLSELAAQHRHLQRLRDLGVGISVDDFGTGWSSLAQLHRLPVTEMKVDRSFVVRLGEEEASALVSGVVGLGHGLGLRVVAEGVETPGQLDALRGLGCDRAQGYLFSRPLPPAVLREQLPVRS